MANWETYKEHDWLNRIMEIWMDAGSAALRSRGSFTVAMDASAECLLACRHLATIDWPWSATRLIPVRENWVPPKHSRHCAHALYQAFYPQKISILQWQTEHLSHEQAAERYAKALRRNEGERPKPDLTLIALASENSLGELEGTAPEYALTAVYEVRTRALPALATTPWLLKASRHLAGISKGLNPPVIEAFKETSPLTGVLESVERTRLLHTR